MTRYVYHWCVTFQTPSGSAMNGGLITRDHKIVTRQDYIELENALRDYLKVHTANMAVTSLTFLHEVDEIQAKE